MVTQCQKNQLPFRYVLADAWFGAAETMVFLKTKCKTDFIFPLKVNRKVAISQEDKLARRYVSVSSLSPEVTATQGSGQGSGQEIWLEGVEFPLLLVQQVFTNKDDSQSNHIFACLWAYVKLESLRLKTRMNHFALKGKLYKAALASAYRELQEIKELQEIRCTA